MSNLPVKIATRGSKLALYQSHKVKEELEKRFPGKAFEIQIIKTKGDKILDVALSKIGDKGLFTRELENSLLQHEADMAVHSLKDMPTELPEGLTLGGVLERGEVRDALVSIHGKKLAELDETDIVATSSLRRKAQLLHFNSKLRIVDIRGNVDTRLKKMAEGYCTAMIMAGAGLQRLGYHDIISEILDPAIMVPAVSQGAIAIEIRVNDPEIESLMKEISHLPTFIAVKAERIFLRALEGGCQIPIGCFSQLSHGSFKITGFVSNLDGSGMLKDSMEGEIGNAEKTALMLAQRFLEKGAQEMIRKIRTLNNI
ncbi:MAG: hydroxymethylbilane synthase [Bacteroidales bacterium]